MSQFQSRVEAPVSFVDEPPRYPDWDGQPLAVEGEVALVVLAPDPPPAGGFPVPVIAAARGGGATFLVRIGQIAEFLRTHAGVRLVCERAGLLHGILESHLRSPGDRGALDCLWEFSRGGRLLDVILMDQLLDMAEHGVEKNPCRLDQIAKSRCDLAIPTSEILQSQVDDFLARSRPDSVSDPGLERSAVTLAEALMVVYRLLQGRTDRCVDERDREEADGKVGPLTIGIQVRGAIALEWIDRRGGLRVEAIGDLIERCEDVYRECSRQLKSGSDSSRCFRWSGDFIDRDDRRGFPVEYDELLTKWLEKCVGEIQGEHGLAFRAPWTKRGVTARSSNAWVDLAPYHPGLSSWDRLWTAAGSTSLLQEARGRNPPVVRPRYQVLPRVRSTSPNLESLRSIAPGAYFNAPAGHSLLVGELVDLGLRCLADSYADLDTPDTSLANLFLDGKDPARYAAAALFGRHERYDDLPYREKFDALERDDPTTFRAYLVIARTALCLAPSGLSGAWISGVIREKLGEATSRIYALVLSEARWYITNNVFPELRRLGADETLRLVDEAILRLGPIRSLSAFMGKREGFYHDLRHVIAGEVSNPSLLARLHKLCTNDEIKDRLTHGSRALYDVCFRPPRRTSVGRVRAMLESHQGIAADHLDFVDDIRKSVLYEIVAAGFDLAAFAGDEFVVIVPDRMALDGTTLEEMARGLENMVERVIAEFLEVVPGRCRVAARPAW